MEPTAGIVYRSARKALLAIVAILGLSFNLRAQDLIVTTSGDSIKCKITTVTPKRVFYKAAGIASKGQQDIAMDEVAMYHRQGYYPVMMSAENKALFVRPKRELEWWLTALGGFSYRTAKAPEGSTPAQKEYVDQLRSAWHGAATLHCFVGKDFALGLEFNSFFGSKASMTGTITFADTTLVGTIADDVRLRYFGADLLWRSKKDGSVRWFSSVGLGRMMYEDRATLINKVTLTGSTFAMVTRLGFDAPVSPKVSLGACASYTFSWLSDFEVDTGSSKFGISLARGSEENLGRFDLSLRLRLHL